MRRSCGQPFDLAALLAEAYRSPQTQEAVPGLRRVILETDGDPRALLAFLGAAALESVVFDG